MSLRKKMKRVESKKRKAESLLFLASAQDTEIPLYEKSSNNKEIIPIMTSALLEELMTKHRKKILEKEQKSVFKLQMHYKFNSIVPLAANKRAYLFVSDLRDLIKATIMCSEDHYNSRWCKISNISKLSKVIFIFVEEATENNYLENIIDLPFVKEFFNSKMSIINPETYLITFEKELFYFKDILGKDLNLTKLDLVLSIDDLRAEEFALPFYNKDLIKDYKFTNNNYLPLSNSSLLFALDCEMVETTEGKEIAWIAVVDENLQCVYETYIKPLNVVKNYLTKFSGITKRKLENVNTRLIDVQIYLQKLIPPDAIIIGHSVKYDLHALKLFHPYIIDTSIIFNLSNNKFKKPKLKELAALFLNREIQSDDIKGHNPREDAEVTLQLVLLKLQHGIKYGDVTNGWTLSDLKFDKKDGVNGQSKSKLSNNNDLNVARPIENNLQFNCSIVNGSQIDPVIYFTQDFTNSTNLFQFANENHKRIVSVGMCTCNFKGYSCKFNSKLCNKSIKHISRELLYKFSSHIDAYKDLSDSKLANIKFTNVNSINFKEDSKIEINDEHAHIKIPFCDQLINDNKTVLTKEKKSNKVKLKKENNNLLVENYSINNEKNNLIFNKNQFIDKNHLIIKNIATENGDNRRKRKLNLNSDLIEDERLESYSAYLNDCDMVISSDTQIQNQDVLLLKLKMPKKITESEENTTQINNYSKLDKRIQNLLKDIHSNSLVLLVFNGKKQENGMCFIQITN